MMVKNKLAVPYCNSFLFMQICTTLHKSIINPSVIVYVIFRFNSPEMINVSSSSSLTQDVKMTRPCLLGNIVSILGAKFYNFGLYYSNKLFWKFNLKCIYMIRQYEIFYNFHKHIPNQKTINVMSKTKIKLLRELNKNLNIKKIYFILKSKIDCKIDNVCLQ